MKNKESLLIIRTVNFMDRLLILEHEFPVEVFELHDELFTFVV